MAITDLTIDALKAREAQIVGMIADSEARLARGDRGRPEGCAVRGGRFVDTYSVEVSLNLQRRALETTRKVLADKMNPPTSKIAGERFISKRTTKGLVIKALPSNRAWFVRAMDDGFGEPKRMIGGAFLPCTDKAEAEQVLFFARRADL